MTDSKIALEELEKIVQLFSSKELPNTCAKALIDSIEKPSSSWSLGNQILMVIHGTSDARGYRQWQEVNRYVRQGAKAFYILGPIIVKRKVIDEETKQEKEESALVGFKGIPVFRYEDTEGKELPVYKPKEIPPLTDVAKAWGLLIKYERVAGEYGHYNFQDRSIILSTEAWDTFFHELAHAGDAMLENHDFNKVTHEGVGEVVAVLTAATLARIYGRPSDAYSWNYIARYAESKKPEAVGRLCIRVLSKVQKIISTIFETKAQIIVPA